MSLSFDSVGEYIGRATALVTAPPFTLFCWYKNTAALTDAFHTLGGVWTSGDGDNNSFSINKGATGTIRARTQDTAGDQATTSNTATDTTTWHLAIGRFVGTANRWARLDDGTEVQNVLSASPTTPNVTRWGANGSAGARSYSRCAFMGIVNRDITTQEAADLYAGGHPATIFGADLISLVTGADSGTPYYDYVLEDSWTAVSVTWVDDDPVIDAPLPSTPAGYERITLAADYADLSTVAKTWVPATAVTGDIFDVKATAGTLAQVSTYLEVAWSTSSGTLSYYWWDASAATYSAEQTQAFAVPAFSGLIQDQFTGTTGTAITAHTPNTDTEAGGWALATVSASGSGITTGNVTLQSGRLSCNAVRVGAEINAGTSDVDLSFDWIIGASDTAAAFHAHARRADTANYVGVYAEQSGGFVRLVRRTAGVAGTIAQASVAFAAGETYRIRFVCLQNDLSIYVNGALQVTSTYAGNQGAADTKVGLFSGSGDLPTVFDNLEVSATTPVSPQQVALSSIPLVVGSTFSYTLSPVPGDAEIPDELTLGGAALLTTGATTAGDTSVAMATLAAFQTGTFNAVPWLTEVDLIVGFPTKNNATTLPVTISGPVPANTPGATHWWGTVGEGGAGVGIFAGLDDGTVYYIGVTSGAIASVGKADGVIIASESGGADFWIYTGAVWAEQTALTFTAISHPQYSSSIVDSIDHEIVTDPVREIFL